jgi:hypothetical protein
MALKISTMLLLALPWLCMATDRKPWFGSQYEVELRASALYQNYHSLSSGGHRLRCSANDIFLTASAAFPFKRYCGEFEATEASTRHQQGRWDNFRITGRYQWLNKTSGDPITLVTGITITEPYSRALHDVSSFHHGHLEGEFFISLGKEYGFPCSQDYLFRWWVVSGIGTAEKGSAWLREEGAAEYNYCDLHIFRLFVETLWGLGKKRLFPHHFRGYGRIHHQSVDIGIRYSLELGSFGTFSFQYARRVYALNFPKDANLALFEYYLPFGRQNYTNY